MKGINFGYKSIRYQTIFSLIGFTILGIVAIYAVLQTVMLSRIDILEKRYVEEHLARANNAIQSETDRLSSVAFDWAVWDTTYDFIKNGNETYVAENLPVETFTNLDINIMAFINGEGEYLYSDQMDLDKAEIVPVSQNFIAYINNSPIIHNADPNYRIQGLTRLPEGVMMISACPILPSNGIGQVAGHVVIGRYLNDGEIGSLADKLNLALEVDQLDNLEPQENQVLNSLKPDVPFITAGDQKSIQGYSILEDIYGQPTALLSITIDRDISAIGYAGIKNVIIYLTGIFVILVVAFLVLLDRKVLSRLLGLSHEIGIIGGSRNVSARIREDARHDEISVVSEEINKMLEELEVLHKDLETKVDERTESLRLEIAKREEIQKKIEHLAYHDHLTDLANRLLFSELLNHALSISQRSGKILAIIYMDLDGFKMINDTLGHAAGDELLKLVADRLVYTLRRSDIIARIGGDEFIIMIENIENIKAIDTIANKILRCFDEPFKLQQQDCYLTTSMGIAEYPVDGDDAETLIKNADIAMYRAKDKGKNQYALCTPLMKQNVLENMRLSNQLYRAIEKGELELYYQPQVNCGSSDIIGLEALLRWHHPEEGMISPGVFIPIAEQTGLIVSIGEWVMRTACQQNKIWQNSGLPKLRMAVNVSVRQMQSPNIAKKVEEILDETGLDPGYLEIEITESAIMKDHSVVIETLDKMKQMGVKVAIDDFGTEYSSLNYIKRLPIDRIKIAMPFIHGIDVSQKDEAIVKAIIVLAKSLELEVIAEGVETNNQLDFLTQRMCDEVQGYYYYKPMPADQVEELLRNMLALSA